MTFLAVFALAIAGLVAAPYFAHRLRRQRARDQSFAPTRLVPATQPKARRRSRLEDRSLFWIRAASIVALALLGASPLVHCSRLAMSRSGTSVAVAIVIDDSMSMRSTTEGGPTRFERAKTGARDILGSLHAGDAAAIVLAGAPARVGLAATTDLGAAKAALDALTPTDRGTDLDGALAVAKTLVQELPQVDRRLIVLSDLEDGRAEAPPLGANAALPVWVAMPELSAPVPMGDCALLSADRASHRVRVRFACSRVEAARGREVRLVDGHASVASTPLPEAAVGEVSLSVSGDDTVALDAELTGKDAIAANDRAAVVVSAGPSAIAIIDAQPDAVATTGRAPIVEQALAALRVDLAVRPLPQVPDRAEDTAAFSAIVIDDPAGFTPEQRRVLSAYVERGGVLFIALGRASASAPLGANFEPLLARPVTWTAAPPDGSAAQQTASPLLGESLSSLTDLAPKGRVRLSERDGAAYEHVLDWSDGAPLVVKSARGRGETWLSTLPVSIETSDFALRPGFLAILDGVVRAAKERAKILRSDVGVPWVFKDAESVLVVGPAGPVVPIRRDGVWAVVPELVGTYALTVDGAKEVRVAAPLVGELDARARTVAPQATSSSLGGGVATVDVSWIVALILLALVAGELVVRAVPRARPS